MEEPNGYEVHLTFCLLLQAPEVVRIQPGCKATSLSASATHAATSPKPHAGAPSDLAAKGTAVERGTAYCDKADCWSAAIFIYEVLCGSSPFGHIRDRQALEHAVLYEPIRAPSWVSAPAAQFLCVALDRAPQARMCITEMLSHPWLASAAEAAAAQPSDTSLLACKEPPVLPYVPTASSAPEKNVPGGGPIVAVHSPHRVVGFAAPHSADHEASPALNAAISPAV